MTPEAAAPMPPARVGILPQVFVPSAALVVLLVVMSFVSPTATRQAFEAAKAWTANEAGWFTILSVAGFLIFVIALGVSKFGTLRLGSDHSRPDYGYGTWFSMLFAAGMGIGLMYFSVAEPVMHFATPPAGEARTAEAARQAMRITFFHWGIHAWAIYAVVALSLAYFAYRHGMPLRIRSALYPLIGDRVQGPIGHLVDTFAVLGTLFGLSTSLGLGVIQINAGMAHLFDWPVGTGTQAALIALITLLATASVFTGLDRGVRRLSELNMGLAIVLMAFVLVTGPTVHLLQAMVQNTGMYVSRLFEMTFHLYAYEPTDWIGGWTLFYWGWWIAWSPFVGLFIARISRGRTVREFVVGVLLVPVGFTVMWMTIYGNTALHMILFDGANELMRDVAADSSTAIYGMLERLPWSAATSMIATLLVTLFFVTSSDSGALVIDMLSSRDGGESPVWQRVFWSLAVGAVAIALLAAGGLTALQAGTIASALPFTVVMILSCVGLVRAMRQDIVKRETGQAARFASTAMGGAPWQDRLDTLIEQPRRRDVLDFVRDHVQPALEDVAAAMRDRGLAARTGSGDDGRIWLSVGHGAEQDFFYSVRPRPDSPPSFLALEPLGSVADDDPHTRAEVHLREGGQNYDVMGWTHHALIQDVLDQYESHLRFLHALRGSAR